MKLGILMVGAALLLAPRPGFAAEVNCKQVNKYLATGRSVSDVAQTMVIDEADVKKCQAQATQGPGSKTGAEKPAGDPPSKSAPARDPAGY
jgi:hypothetical protein